MRIQHLVSQKWASLSDISKDISHVLAHHPNRPLPLVNARNGKWVPAQVAPQCVRSAHKNACASAMATAALVPNDPARLPLAEATNASQPSNSDTSPSQTFGAGMPNPGERLGFNLVCKKCSPQNYKGGGGVWVGQKSGGWVLSKVPPPPWFPPFFPVFLRFSPFFPVLPRFSPFFPRFSLLPGTKRRLGMGTLDPCLVSRNYSGHCGEVVETTVTKVLGYLNMVVDEVRWSNRLNHYNHSPLH